MTGLEDSQTQEKKGIGMASRIRNRNLLLTLCCCFLVIVLGCVDDETVFVMDAGKVGESPSVEYAPLATFAAMTIPADNPISSAKVDLGRQLFFDARLSGDGALSCYSCHLNEKGLSDGRSTAVGAFEKALTRNSPTLWNIGYHHTWYWDGRADSLEGQALAAWKGGNMGAANYEEIVAALNGIEEYRQQFQAVFGEDATADNVPKALASYMRTIVSGSTPWDTWQAGDDSAISEAAKRGAEVFKKANCENCHSGVLFTDLQFHNVGIGMDAADPDVGRFTVTEIETDMGAFKTPTLRDVSDSAPYFHNGSVATLEDAVRIMVNGGIANDYLDSTNLQPAGLTDEEISDLVEFLKALDEPTELEIPTVPGMEGISE